MQKKTIQHISLKHTKNKKFIFVCLKVKILILNLSFRLKLWPKVENFTFKHTKINFFFKCVVKIFFNSFN
jgi:hypothetical protein